MNFSPTKRILIVANIFKHIKAFHLPYIELLQDKGYEVHVAANDNSTKIDIADKQFEVPIQRNPFHYNNLKAISVLKEIMAREKYSLVHCNTAMGSVTARLAARSFRKKGLKVIYTAHGFHFFKGSPKIYWLLYYPTEKFLSRYTDAIITINKEDYNLIQQNNFKNKFSFLIPGIGVEKKKFNQVDEDVKIKLRKKNNLNENDFILLYVAEYIHRKNHEFLVKAALELKGKIPNLKLLFAGRGELMNYIKNLIEDTGQSDTIIQLGFRSDIDEIMKLSDIGLSSSRQEGLGLNLVEEMMCGIPVVATIDRGHKEVVDHSKNGFLFAQNHERQFLDFVLYLYENPEKRKEMGIEAKIKSKQFELSNCLQEMDKIYKKFLHV